MLCPAKIVGCVLLSASLAMPLSAQSSKPQKPSSDQPAESTKAESGDAKQRLTSDQQLALGLLDSLFVKAKDF